MHRTLQKCHCEPVTDVTGVAIRSFLCTAPLVTRGNGFPRRCAPRNDILTKIILPCVGAGFYPARSAAPSRLSPVGRRPCVPPLDTLCILSGGAHWPRPTGVLPTPHPMSRTRRAGCPHPAADMHRIPKKPVIANRRARRCGNPSLFFSPFHPKNQTKNYAKHKNPKTPCE